MTDVNKFDSSYLAMTACLAMTSYAIRKKVGALLVDYSGQIPRIISDGINGTNPGECNHCESSKTGKTFQSVRHAEYNCIEKVSHANMDLSNHTLYVTTKPCPDCAKLIVESGIKRVVYSFTYSNDLKNESDQIFADNGVSAVKLDLPMMPYSTMNLDYSGYLRNKGLSEQAVDNVIKQLMETSDE